MSSEKNPKDNTILTTVLGGLFAVIAACISLIPSFKDELFGGRERSKPAIVSPQKAPVTAKVDETKASDLISPQKQYRAGFRLDKFTTTPNSLIIDFSIRVTDSLDNTANSEIVHYKLKSDMVKIIGDDGLTYTSSSISVSDEQSSESIVIAIGSGSVIKARAYISNSLRHVENIQELSIGGSRMFDVSLYSRKLKDSRRSI